ncbi:MAG: amidohydrolase family protein [Planctomycetes bacterium]|nr:amidohydrolase family protein [Planctomycetota bacterium]
MRYWAIPAILWAIQEDSTPGEPAVAITGARILTVTKGEIVKGTILLRGGKIEAVGADVQIPDHAIVVRAADWVALPGFVHPYTRIGGSASGSGSKPAHVAKDELNPARDDYRAVVRSGFTTLALYPNGGPLSGQSIAYKPRGVTREQMMLHSPAYLRMNMEASTAVKQQLQSAFEAARRAIEASKKPPAPAPPGKPAEPAAPDPIAQFLKGELRGVIELTQPAEYLHFRQVMQEFDDPAQKLFLALTPEFYRAKDVMGARKERLLMRPEPAAEPYTRAPVNAAAELAEAGCEVGFLPGDNPSELPAFLFRVARLVKLGLARETALKAMTIVPAQAAGVGDRVGSLEPGKDADIVLLDADPWTGTARIMKVFIDGKIEFELKP